MKEKDKAEAIMSVIVLTVVGFAIYGVYSLFFKEDNYKARYEAEVALYNNLKAEYDTLNKRYCEDKIQVLEVTEEVTENEQLDQINEKLDYIQDKLDNLD